MLIEKAAARDANIIFGASIKEDLEDEIRITVIATGFEDEEEENEIPEEPAPAVRHAAASAASAAKEEDTAAASADNEPQQELPEEDDIEVPEFLKNAMKAVNNKF